MAQSRSILHPPARTAPPRRESASGAKPRTPTPEPAPDVSALPSDSVLLARFAALDADPEAVAAELNIRLDLLLDWLRAPETIRRLNILLEHRALIAQAREDLKRSAMLDSIQQLHDRARSEGDHIEQRRAATVYLRFSHADRRPRRLTAPTGAPAGAQAIDNGVVLSLSRFPASYRTRSRAIRTTPVLHEPPAILPGPDHPDPAESPEQAMLKLLHRLQDSDNPSNGDGLRTLFNYFTQAMRDKVEARTADQFACTDLPGYHCLLGHNSAVLCPTMYPEGTADPAEALQATQQAHIVDLDGFRHRIVIRFTRADVAAPWLIDGFRLEDPDTGPAAASPGPESGESARPPPPREPPPV